MEHAWKIYVAAWFCTMLTVCLGMYLTKSAWCMWGLVLPTLLKFESSTTNKSEEEEKSQEDDK